MTLHDDRICRRERHPEIPWREIIGIRNRLVHGYDAIDLDIAWQVATADLPALLPLLESIVASESA